MKRLITILLILGSVSLAAQEQDSIPTNWKPDPYRAVWMGAILPGAGQIYNRSYWKLPIVYGGFMGCAYAIMWTNGKYVDYKQAYRDILADNVISTDPNRSYNKLLPKGYTSWEQMGYNKNSCATMFENNQNNYRRYRDYSIVATILLYGLTIIDAYVDAQLFDFDISPDLSMNVEPDLYYDELRNTRTPEVHLAITF